ncbi:hypothetical protein WJX79_004743 [Trebouxia sp. C0005]
MAQSSLDCTGPLPAFCKVDASLGPVYLPADQEVVQHVSKARSPPRGRVRIHHHHRVQCGRLRLPHELRRRLASDMLTDKNATEKPKRVSALK